MSNSLNLSASGLRFHLRIRRSVHFPEGKAANVIRSALGMAMKRAHCSAPAAASCSSPDTCPRSGDCQYARIFAPSAPEASPSGFHDLPRPFVLRASHLNGKTFPANSECHFDFHFLTPSTVVIRDLGAALVDMSSAPFGPGDGAIQVTRVETLDAHRQPAATFNGKNIHRIDLSIPPPILPVPSGHLKLTLHSPLDLRSQGKPVQEPNFSVLFSRLRERLLLLSALYHGGTLQHFNELRDLATEVQLLSWTGSAVSVERRSGSQNRSHEIGGIIGAATYAGPISPFIAWLSAAQWTGIGKHAVWGNGQLTFSVEATKAS